MPNWGLVLLKSSKETIMQALKFDAQLLPQLTEWIGFDRTFKELQEVSDRAFKAVKYPPYNVRKIDENHYVVEMAVAGFGRTDIDITTKGEQLVIRGEIKEDSFNDYVYKGIAERAFERSFTLADSVVVKNASLVNGMLRVWLEQFIPEEKQPRKIEVQEADSADLKTLKPELLTEGKKAKK